MSRIAIDQEQAETLLGPANPPGRCSVATSSSVLASTSGLRGVAAVRRAMADLVDDGLAVEVRKGDPSTAGLLAWPPRARERSGWVRAEALRALQRHLMHRAEGASDDARVRACRAQAEAVVLARHAAEVDAEVQRLLGSA